ncbi:monovalent cation/H(+) antiporter subunit G [Prescottella agglutinans]|uniref:monovalent cation/H(+) antiporter subunit G n=1 Tax=Prescottella agglutinans TaxID=1644129 RepID=UPI003D97C3E1
MTAVVWVLAVAGAGAVVASTLSSLGLGASPVFGRLHLLTVCTSLGAPLLAIALILDQGLSAASGTIALTVALLVGTGPAAGAAIARMTAHREALARSEVPE